jgi:hypothetical protein
MIGGVWLWPRVLVLCLQFVAIVSYVPWKQRMERELRARLNSNGLVHADDIIAAYEVNSVVRLPSHMVLCY